MGAWPMGLGVGGLAGIREKGMLCSGISLASPGFLDLGLSAPRSKAADSGAVDFRELLTKRFRETTYTKG